MDETPLEMIETPAALEALVERLTGLPVLGIDTEADSMHHYREKVCLIQISDDSTDYIVDPLAPDMDLSPLGEIMSDRNVVKIFHGADYDVVSLKRDFGFSIRGIFDTMITAQLLDMPKVGLADLVNGFFAFKMDKKYQTHDWARRPLLPEHLYYARGDTHYLLALRELLNRRLERAGLLEIAEEEFRLLEDRSWRRTIDPATAFLKTKGSNKLGPKGLRVLRQLHKLRDGHAERMDRPPYKVMPDQVLVKVAETRPTSIKELGEQLRSKSSMFRRYGDQLVEAVKVGLEDKEPIPKPPKKARTGTRARYGSREAERLFVELKTWRKRVMHRDEVPMVLVANNSQLKALAGFRPHSLEELDEIDEMRQWQRVRYGEELVELIDRFEKGLPPKALPGEDTSDKKKDGKGRRRRRRSKRDDSAGSEA